MLNRSFGEVPCAADFLYGSCDAGWTFEMVTSDSKW